MELMYSSEATDKQFAQRNVIIERSNRNGYVTAEDAKWLMDFDRKYRRCNKRMPGTCPLAGDILSVQIPI